MISFRTSAVVVALIFASSAIAQKVEVVNNQPFPIRMPWQLLDGTRVFVDVAGNGKQTVDRKAKVISLGVLPLFTRPVENGLALIAFGRDSHTQNLGTLQWDIIVDKIDKKAADEDAHKTKRDYDAIFKAIPLTFTPGNPSYSVERWSAEGEKSGIKLHIDVEVHPEGFIDIHSTVTNVSAPTSKVYCAVVTRWQRPAGATSSVGYDNHITPLKSGESTRFREGGIKHLFLQRGVDWINSTLGDTSIAWMNDFAQSFTIHHEKTAKTQAQWRGGNAPQLGQEAALSGDVLYSVTEIARPMVKYYQSRFTGDTLPMKDDPLTFSSRLMVSKEKLSDERVDQLFVGWTSYNAESKDGETTRLTLGVPFVKFGTAYFPYSTLGENFEHWHMPGMSKESYWPLAADVVKNYKLFADDIKRDLRIAKAMGFQTIRLHHLEMLDPLPREQQDAFLDFYFGELKHLGLTALLDVKLPPDRTVELVKKYRAQVDGVEVDNEVLIFGIPDNDVAGWKKTYAAVKAAAPDLPVHFTGQTNTGAFDRLKKLEVPFDKVGLHSYNDSLEAIPSARDFALAVSDYASEIGKEPIITEWNWRFLTRMTPEDRAKIYPPIFENVFAARCMPVFYQFQFQESLAMAPHTLRAIRHYDLLALSRRPRPEALEFIKLIQKYGDPKAPQSVIQTRYQVVDPAAMNNFPLTVTNGGQKKFTVHLRPEALGGLQISLNRTIVEIPPGATATIYVKATLPDDALPGFYQGFVRCEAEGMCAYSWFEIRKPGAPQFDKGTGVNPEVNYLADARNYDFNRDIAIVYPDGREKDSRWDVESAWLIYQTLESATGRPVKIFQQKDLPADLAKTGNLIMVQMPGWNGSTQPTKDGKAYIKREPANTEHGDRLLVCGDDEAALSKAAEDLVLRYWKYAKDSGARRIELTDKPIDKGGDVGALP